MELFSNCRNKPTDNIIIEETEKKTSEKTKRFSFFMMYHFLRKKKNSTIKVQSKSWKLSWNSTYAM